MLAMPADGLMQGTGCWWLEALAGGLCRCTLVGSALV